MSDFIKILIVCFGQVVLTMIFFATIIFLRNKFYAWKRPEKKQIEISKKEFILYSIIYFIILILDALFLRWRQL